MWYLFVVDVAVTCGAAAVIVSHLLSRRAAA